MIHNKKGQGMSTTTIILLVLGLAILVVLIFGFSTGWKAFKNVASPTNVDTVVDDCQTQCGLKQKFSYCSTERTLRVNEENIEIASSCAVFAHTDKFSHYGVEKCPDIKCESNCTQIKVNEVAGSLTDNAALYTIKDLAVDVTGAKVDCFIN